MFEISVYGRNLSLVVSGQTSGHSLMEPEFQGGVNIIAEPEQEAQNFAFNKEMLMKNLGRVAVVVAAILATFVGIKFAKEETRIERTQSNIEKMKVAGWIKVEGNEFVTFYIDPSTIRKTDNGATMLTLVDFKTVNNSGGRPHMSTKTQHEYDCTENQWRLLEYSYHSGNMGGGEIVYSEANLGTWEPVKPGSGTKTRWKLACGK